MKRRFVFFVIFAAIVTSVLSDRTLAQVTSDRLLRASEEPQNWITYSGGYAGLRHSPLTQITPANVKNLELKWILPNQVFGAWQSSPIRRRDDVHHAASQRRPCRRCEDRSRLLAVPLRRLP